MGKEYFDQSNPGLGARDPLLFCVVRAPADGPVVSCSPPPTAARSPPLTCRLDGVCRSSRGTHHQLRGRLGASDLLLPQRDRNLPFKHGSISDWLLLLLKVTGVNGSACVRVCPIVCNLWNA
jgi:hypothetical protein